MTALAANKAALVAAHRDQNWESAVALSQERQVLKKAAANQIRTCIDCDRPVRRSKRCFIWSTVNRFYSRRLPAQAFALLAICFLAGCAASHQSASHKMSSQNLAKAAAPAHFEGDVVYFSPPGTNTFTVQWDNPANGAYPMPFYVSADLLHWQLYAAVWSGNQLRLPAGRDKLFCESR